MARRDGSPSDQAEHAPFEDGALVHGAHLFVGAGDEERGLARLLPLQGHPVRLLLAFPVLAPVETVVGRVFGDEPAACLDAVRFRAVAAGAQAQRGFAFVCPSGPSAVGVVRPEPGVAAEAPQAGEGRAPVFPFGPGEQAARGGGRVELHGVAGQREPGSGPFAQFGDGVQFRGADHARLVYDDELSGVDEAGLFPGVGFADGAAYPVAFGGGARRGEPAPVFASQVVGLRPVPFGYVVEELGDGDRVGADAVGELVPGPDGQGSGRARIPSRAGSPMLGRRRAWWSSFRCPAGPMSALAACGFSSRYAAAFAWSSLSRFPPARMDWMSRVPSPGPQARGSARPNVAMTRFSMSRIVWLVYRSSVGSSNVLRPARLTSAGSSPACPAR